MVSVLHMSNKPILFPRPKYMSCSFHDEPLTGNDPKRYRALVMLLTRVYLSILQKRRIVSHANAKSKSEKFPPPHQDGAVGFPLGSSNQMDPLYEPPDPTSFSTVFAHEKSSVPTWSGPLVNSSAVGNQKRKHKSSRSSKQPSSARAR